MAHLRIAMIGARGFGNYGGFETLVSELAPRLTGRNHDVYCSHEMAENGRIPLILSGPTAIYFPLRFPRNYTLRKIMENLYDWYFVTKCTLSPRCDVIYCLGTLSSFLLLVPKLLNVASVVNVDGLEWKREKLSSLERTILKLYFAISCWLSDNVVIDNKHLKQYVPNRFRDKVVFIPYGASRVTGEEWDYETIARYVEMSESSVGPGNYWLSVARLEPENNTHAIIEGYIKSKSTKSLIIVGDSTSPKYKTRLDYLLSRIPKNKKVLMPGSIYNKATLDMLRVHCFAYLHGHSVGGTNPSLLEAMSAGNLIIAHDNQFNREVCDTTALYFREAEDLASRLDDAEQGSEILSKLGTAARRRVLENYDWEDISNLYNEMFLKALDQ